MIYPKNKNLSYYLLFLVWPFGALVPAIRKFREPIGRTLFILVLSFLGFTATSEGDLSRYEMYFYSNQNNTIFDILKSYISLQRSDIYTDLLSYITGIFFNTHHVYFALLYAIFGYLYSGVLLNFLKLYPLKLTKILLVVFLGFALYYSIRSTISIRFYTGALFFLYMFTNYIITNKRKFLYYSLFTPLFHFGLGITLSFAFLFPLLKNRLYLAFILVIASFFIGQSTIINGLDQIVSKTEDTFIESRYSIYAADEGRERLEAHYAERYINYNWKAKSLEILGKYIFYICIVFLFLLFFLKRKFTFNPYLKNLFLLTMLLLASANLMTNVSNGDRYVHLFVFIFLGFCFLLLGMKIFKGIMYHLLFLINILGLTFGIASLYAANPLFTYQFFLFNYVLVLFTIN